MPLRIRFARIVALLLLPFGLICLGTPLYMMMQPDRRAILGDTRAALGGGRDAGMLRAAYVDCTGSRSGSSSGRGIGMTEYGCVIDLTDAPVAAPPPASAPPASPPAAEPAADPYAGLGYEEAMAKWEKANAEQNRRLAEHSRQINAGIEALAQQRRARAHPSNRIERKLALDMSGDLPVVRILSAEGEPRRVGLVWGAGELVWRWVQWLVILLIFWGFGAALLLPAKLAFWPKRGTGNDGSAAGA